MNSLGFDFDELHIELPDETVLLVSGTADIGVEPDEAGRDGVVLHRYRLSLACKRTDGPLAAWITTEQVDEAIRDAIIADYEDALEAADAGLHDTPAERNGER